MPRRAAIASFLALLGATPSARADSPPLWQEGRTAPPLVAAPSWAKLVRMVAPAVVHISVTEAPEHTESAGMRQFYREYFGEGAPPPPNESVGTGFIINRAGYVLTNDHVIEGAEDIVVALNDERRYTARVVGADAETDIALLKIDADEDLPVIHLGDSDALEVGDAVAAIGNPFNLAQTVTTGIVSAKGRGPEDIGETEGSRLYDFIQTDAAINFGNSGGPLIDAAGNVVGMNTAIYTGAAEGGEPTYAQGIGFAIPIDMIKRLLPALVSHGGVTRGYLGVLPQSLTPILARAFKLPSIEGALIALVRPDSPAAKAGLTAGDCIVRLDGLRVRNAREFRFALAVAGAGTPVHVTYVRAGVEHEVAITLTPAPSLTGGPSPAPRAADAMAHGSHSLGLSVTEISPDVARQDHLDASDGVVVTTVDAGSLALAAGFAPDDVVLTVDGASIHSLDDYSAALRRATKGDVLLFLVQPATGLRHYVALVAP